MRMRPPESEVTIKAVRSRGPGGQNVNKVSSAAVAHWDYQSSASFTDAEKRRLSRKLKNIINAEGFVHMRSDEYRDLPRNKAKVYEKLVAAVNKALIIPKKRKKTKPSRAQKEKRLETKSRRSNIKANRQKVRHSD